MNCPHLSSLNISGCTEVTDQALECLSINCRTIQSLDLSRTKVCYTVTCCTCIQWNPYLHGRHFGTISECYRGFASFRGKDMVTVWS